MDLCMERRKRREEIENVGHAEDSPIWQKNK